jgi:hypothetical protein
MDEYVTVPEMVEAVYEEGRDNSFGSFTRIEVVNGCIIELHEDRGEFVIWEEVDQFVVTAKHINRLGIGDTLVEAVRDALSKA